MSDPTVDVRDEDAFDVGAVDAWLRGRGADVPDGTPQVRQFPGGASNLTYLLSYPSRDLILRRPPTGAKAKSAHDMNREYTIQSRLAPVFGLVPDMVAFCDDPDVIGSDFYVMQRLDGTILRRDLPDGMTLGEQDARTLQPREVNGPGRLRGHNPLLLGDLAAQCADRRVEHERRADRLEEYAVKPDAVGLFKDVLATVGGDHDAPRRPLESQRRDLTGCFSAIQVRHAPVEEHEGIWVRALRGALDCGKGLAAGCRLIDTERHAAQHLGQSLQRQRVVVDDEEAHAPEVWLWQVAAGRRLSPTESRGEEKRAAPARLALDADLAAHQLRQALADRKPESGSTVLAGGGRVGL